MDQFPGNSHTSRTAEPKPEETTATEANADKPQQIVSGKVVKKKSIGTQFKEIFVHDGGNFVEDLIANMVIPTIKEMMLTAARKSAEGFVQGIEGAIFPGGRAPGNNRPSGGPISYNQRFTSSTVVGNAQRSMPTHRPQTTFRRSNVVAEIILEEREHCDMVTMELDGKIEAYGHCTVGDLYDLVGQPSTSTDQEWGWTDVSRFRSMAVSEGGFRLMTPRPVPIDTGR